MASKVGGSGNNDRQRPKVKPAETKRPQESGTSRESNGSRGLRRGNDPPSSGSRPQTLRRTDENHTPRRLRTEALDRDPVETPSDSDASREVTRRQASLAARLTGNGDSESPSVFDNLEAEDGVAARVESGEETSGPDSAEPTEESNPIPLGLIDQPDSPTPASDPTTANGDNDPLDHLVEDPIEAEQRSDLQDLPGFEPGSDTPEFPDFADQAPTSTRNLPTGGTEETFVENGRTYTRNTRPDGTVSTSYEQGGVDYSNTAYEDGRNSTLISTSGDNGTYTRTVETGPDGQVSNDTSSATDAATDPETGEITLQSRQVSLDSEGVRTITEEVTRPDGGRSNVTRVEQPDGRVVEDYSFEGDQGTVTRSTNQAADGTAEVRTERNYTVDEDLETLIDAPGVPESYQYEVVPLPDGERGETTIREVEVATVNAQGVPEVQYAEESFSQSSGDVALNGSEDLGHTDPTRDTFPSDIAPDNEASNITHTVTRVSARDENNNLVESTGASQTLHIEGDRRPEFGQEGEVSASRTISWNSAGESSESFSARGFHEGDLLAINDGDSVSSVGIFSATVGGNYLSAGYPEGAGGPYSHYTRKGGGELEDWLGPDSTAPLDIDITLSRDADGNQVSRDHTFSTVDENGNGRTAVRSDNGDSVAWTYTNFENDGQDFQRQTVFEGTDVSIYEDRETLSDGQFRSTSETRDGDDILAMSQASRLEVQEADLRQLVTDGQLTTEQLDRIRQDGPPYYVEQFSEHAEALLDDDGNLRRDDEGNPFQAGHDVTSMTVSNTDGYSVSEQFRQDFGEGTSGTDSRLTTVTDPEADMPVTGELVQRERDSNGNYEVLEQGEIAIGADGRATYDGEEIGEFDFGGTDLSTLLREGESITAPDLIKVLGGAAKATRDSAALTNFAGGRFNLTGQTGALANLAKGASIFGVFVGADQLFSGLQDGDVRSSVQGLGKIAGGANSLAAATSALAGGGRVGSAAARFSTLSAASSTFGKVLGGASGALNLGFGLYDVFTADSGFDQAAGGLTAAAGAVAIGSTFFGPPGWVVGGLLSASLQITAILVAGGDENETASIDERLQS